MVSSRLETIHTLSTAAAIGASTTDIPNGANQYPSAELTAAHTPTTPTARHHTATKPTTASDSTDATSRPACEEANIATIPMAPP